MAKIEDLVRQISDEKLRDELASEVRELKKHKRFGLVFEEHLPEMLRLPKAAIRVGNLVAHRDSSGSEVWRVIQITGKKAKCRQPINPTKYDQDMLKDFPLDELVLVVSFGEPIYPVLTPIDRVNRGGPDKPWHVIINAENYHALQLLLYSHERKIDLIYIDPPYNTGARDWKYNNDYVDKTDAWRHSKWLSMMKKRLSLAKRLLNRDGILVITVDDNEVHHLLTLAEEIFPAYEPFIVTIEHNKRGRRGKNFGKSNEFALFFVPGNRDLISEDFSSGTDVHMAFWKEAETKTDPLLAKLELYALSNDASVLNELKEYANKRFEALDGKYRAATKSLKQKRRQLYSKLRQAGREFIYEDWELPEEILEKADGESYERHLYCNEVGKFQTKLNGWEKAVLNRWAQRDDFVGWLRNPSRKQWSFTVAYQHGAWKGFHPDLLIIRRASDKLVIDVLEPHQTNQDDTFAKAKGLAEYAAAHGLEIGQAMMLKVDGQGDDAVISAFDVTDRGIREKVLRTRDNEQIQGLFRPLSR